MRQPITIFLGGDVMTGRGIDQVLPHPSDPRLHEPWVQSATEYVDMAERASGSIPKPVAPEYIWGDALQELSRAAPGARIINLETSVTTSEDWFAKGINYRMHPANVACLTAARVDCCVLANNHVLDYGRTGLIETLGAMEAIGVQTTGAGRDLKIAMAPAIVEIGGVGRILVFAWGARDSGVPSEWAATNEMPGVAYLPDFTERAVSRIGNQVASFKKPGDIAILSIHWGANWGYRISPEHRGFAHRLIEAAGVDVVHGHSSHHPKGIEVYKGKLILYGCGDFINDYEGIGGYEEYRGRLTLMYLPTIDAQSGQLTQLEMAPFELRRFQLRRASTPDAAWMRDTLAREGKRLGTRVRLDASDRLVLEW